MISRKTWEEFRETGLLWWINTQLHLFGWALVVEQDENNNTVDTYPARVKFRGFGSNQVEKGYQILSEYLSENIEDIKKETYE